MGSKTPNTIQEPQSTQSWLWGWRIVPGWQEQRAGPSLLQVLPGRLATQFQSWQAAPSRGEMRLRRE